MIIYDTINDKKINIPFPIYKYDTNNTITEKIYISTVNNSSTNNEIDIIRLYYKFIIIESRDDKMIKFYSLRDYIIKNNYIYEYNILKKDIYDTFIFSDIITKIRNDIKNIDETTIQNLLFNILKTEYYKNVNRYLDIPIDLYIKLQEKLYQMYKSDYENIKHIKSTDFKKIIKYDKNNDVTYNIKNINIINILHSKSNTNYYLNIIKLYKSLQLDNTIPFIAININNIPNIKVYEKFEDKKILLNWFVNEKNKLKSVKGLYMKYIYNKDLTVNINIFNNGEVNISIDNTGRINFVDTNKINIHIINYIIGNINKYFFNLDTKLLNTHTKIIYLSFNIHSNMNSIDLTRIIDNNKKFYRLISNTKDSIKMAYRSHAIMILRKHKTKNDVYFEINCNIKYNTDYLLDNYMIDAMLHDTALLFLQKPIIRIKDSISLFESANNLKFTIHDKETANIKLLRKKGIIVKAVNCQKFKQPIVTKSSFKLKTGYPLEYDNNVYICPNKKIPYPGITVTNDICCFKKDQRNKTVYKKFFNKDIFKINYTDLKNNMEKHIIKTDKLLDFGRLGIFNNNLFKDQLYYRLGNYNNYYSLLNIFNVVSKTNIDMDLIIGSLTEKKYKTFLISNIINYSQFLYKLQNQESSVLEHRYIIDILLDYFQLNCFVICDNNIIYYHINDKPQTIVINKFMSVGYELVINNNKSFVFNSNSLIISNLLKYVKFIPESINYSTSRNIYTKYLSKIKTKQIVTINNDVVFFYTTIYGFIPINHYNSKMIEKVDSICINSVSFDNLLLDYNIQLDKINKLIIKYPLLKKQYTPISFILHPNHNTILGIKCINGMVIPIKHITSPKILSLKIEYSYFYPDFYNMIDKEIVDSRVKNMFVLNYYNELFLRLKLKLSMIISKNTVLKIDNIKDSDTTFVVKFNTINRLLVDNIKDDILLKSLLPNKPIELPLSRIECDQVYCLNNKLGIEEKYFKLFINIITNEILNGNTDIKNKKINVEIEDKNHFIIRQYEKIITNISDLKSFVKT